MLGLEDTGSRMSRLGKAELVHGEYVGLDEALRRVRAVTAEDVQGLAADLAARPRSLAVVGPFDADREFPGAVACRCGLESVAVIGARGRMGRPVCAAVEAADGPGARARGSTSATTSTRSPGADVAVVFSVPDVAVEHVLACVRHGVHAVVGTTGWSGAAARTPCARPPGRSPGGRGAGGAELRPRRGAADALRGRGRARTSSRVEVVELHHPDKVDAPSGTARATAERIAAARAATPGSAPVPGRHQPPRWTAPAARTWTASGCTRSGCAGWSRTRRSCWAARGSS